jgi:hypothetical protein
MVEARVLKSYRRLLDEVTTVHDRRGYRTPHSEDP